MAATVRSVHALPVRTATSTEARIQAVADLLRADAHAGTTRLSISALADRTSLRHENEQLRLHVELYEEHIRRLTVENTRLTAELAQQQGVAHLASQRNCPTPQ